MSWFSGWLMAGGLIAASRRRLNYAAGAFIGKGLRVVSAGKLLVGDKDVELLRIEKHQSEFGNVCLLAHDGIQRV